MALRAVGIGLGVALGRAIGGASDVYATACATTDSCVTVGYYKDNSDQSQAYVAPITGGAPSAAVRVTLPATADTSSQDASLDGVSCQSENTCEAYGSYDSSGVDEPMVVQITDGVPATEVEVIPPAGSLSGQNVELQGISCSSSSACVAVGSYETTGYADRPRGPDLGRGAGAVRGAFFAR